MLKKVQSRSDSLILSMNGFLVGVGDSNTVVGVGAGDVLVAGSSSVIPISISIARLSRPLAVGVVDVVAIGSVVVRAALVDKGVTTTIAISRLSRPLAVSIAAISIATISSGQTLGAPVDRAGATIGMVGNSAIAISGLSLSIPLAITAISIATISVAAIVSRESLGRSVGVASAAIAISGLSLSIPLAIAIDVVAIGVLGRAVAIAMVSLRHIHRGRPMTAITISRLSLCLPLAIIPIAIAAMETLGRSVGVAHTRVGVVGGAIAIARLGSSEAGEREDDLK